MSFLSTVLSFFGLYKQPEALAANESYIPVLEGTHGLIEADSMIGREGGKIAIAVDFEFGDVPSWVEWDVDLKQVSIAQHGGAVAILETDLGEKEASDFENTSDLMFCSLVEGERVIHRIPLILRNSNDNDDKNMAEFGQELAV